MKKRIFSILIVLCVLCNTFNINAFANEETPSYILSENGATWGEIRNGFVIIVTINNDNQVYITKASLESEDNDVYEKEFHFVTNYEQYSPAYWEEIVLTAYENNVPWKLVSTISVNSTDISTNSNLSAPVMTPIVPSDEIGTNIVVVPNPEVPNNTRNAIKYKLDKKYGITYMEKHLFTNTTSYPGYRFTIWENHSTTITECSSSLEFEKKSTLGALAAALIAAIPGIGTVGVVITALAEFYNIAASASTLMNQDGNLITFRCKSILSRYVTVNNGTVTYSSADKIRTCYIHYDTSVVNNSLGELKYESNSYIPSEYSFNSSGYKWLIDTAYNAYT